jgi:Transposase
MLATIPSTLRGRFRSSTTPQGLPRHRLPIMPSPHVRAPVPSARSRLPFRRRYLTCLPTAAVAACVGSDWADAQHAVGLHAAGAETRACSVLVHTPDTLDAWVRTLRPRFQGPPMARGLERHTGPLVSARRKDTVRVRFPVTPLTLARSRAAVAPSHATAEPTDAELQLALRRTHRDQLTPLKPQRPTMRPLAPLVAQRRRLVGDHVRLTKRLPRTLKNSCPHVLHWVHDKDPARCCAVLTPWPPLKAAPLARRTPLERCFRAPHVRDADGIAQRRQAIQSATPLTTAEGVSVPQALLAQALSSQLRGTVHASEDVDTAIAQHAHRHPDCPLCAALPGAGAVFAPRLRVACGEPRDRYASADARQQSAGIAPVTERRGNTTWVHWRLQGPTCWRHTVVEWAAESTPHACWARAYDQPQRHPGSAPQAAIRARACKGMRLLCRCWQPRTPYDASIDRHALHRRGSPLMRHLAHVV